MAAPATEYLRQRGYDVELANPTPPLTEPNALQVAPLELLDQHVLDCIRYQDRAVIEYGDVSVAHLITQIVHAWPQHRIAILVARVDDGISLARQLESNGGPIDYAHRNLANPRSARAVITTYTPRGFYAADSDTWDMVICVDGQHAIRNSALDLLSHARRARFYALLPLGTRLAPFDHYRLHAFFGFDRVAVPRHGHIVRPIEVAFTRICGGPTLDTDDIVHVKSRLIWSHPVRNRRLTALAVALAMGDNSKIAKLCPDALRSAVCTGDAASVMMIVEGTEHRDQIARELARQQSDWPRATGFPGGPRVTVATFDDITVSDCRACDIVVRADSGVGLPQLPDPIALAVPWDSHQRLLLLDSDDREHPELRRRTRARKRAYRKSGWLPPGVDLHRETIRQFLDSIYK
jgi:hypothetical protein